MTLPSADTIGKGVVITAIALVIINLAKPYLPAGVRSLLSS